LSHVVSIKTQIKDAAAVAAACRRLNLAEPKVGKAELFSGSAHGLLVQLPEWVYPVVCNTASGELRYDNFEGRWGNLQELDKFKQAYSVEKARIEARRSGNTVTETQLADGSIKLTIQVAGGAA